MAEKKKREKARNEEEMKMVGIEGKSKIKGMCYIIINENREMGDGGGSFFTMTS